VCIASVLRLGLGLVGPMEPPVHRAGGRMLPMRRNKRYIYSLCPSEKAAIRLSVAHARSSYRQRKVIHWLKAMYDERDKML